MTGGAAPPAVAPGPFLAPAGSPDPTAGPSPVASFEQPLARPVLDPPIVLTGGFGEYRSNHFHAGLDFGTGGRVGRPVYAPLPGWVERVRASGVGYGRSIYLHAADGRLLVFGHLDAYEAPLAAFVAAAQESSGQYEQDLWPARGRFRFAAGERIGWTGESGAGGPHLHFEIRRADEAYNPLRAGFSVADTSPPSLPDLILEPLDDTSYVEQSAAPVRVALSASPPRIAVVGRVRAVVGARDGVWRGVDRMVPWSVRLDLEGEHVECRFDSVSWAIGTAESDFVYDSGQVAGERGFVLWAPPGFRPRVFRTSAPAGAEAGVITVRPGDPPRTLRITARDVAGQVSERSVILEPPPAGGAAPDTSRASERAGRRRGGEAFQFEPAGERSLRVTYSGAPAGSRGVVFEISPLAARRYPASERRGDWSAVLPVIGAIEAAITVSGRDGAETPWQERTVAVLQPASGGPLVLGDRAEDVLWELPAGGLFEPRVLRWEAEAPGATPDELAPVGPSGAVHPATLRLAKAATVRLRAPGPPDPRVAIYRFDGTSWDHLGGERDAEGYLSAGSRYLGRFALLADTLAPRVRLRPAPARGALRPYSRWALEARVREEGSGVEARGSWFEVDGRRVPSEWDPEAGVLRWRPARPPAAGTHRCVVVVADRAGNERRTAGRFVVK